MMAARYPDVPLQEICDFEDIIRREMELLKANITTVMTNTMRVQNTFKEQIYEMKNRFEIEFIRTERMILDVLSCVKVKNRNTLIFRNIPQKYMYTEQGSALSCEKTDF